MKTPKAIRKGYVCMFHKDCSGCAMKNLCVSASSLVSEPRAYLLRNKGYRVPRTEAMQQGIIKHELYQRGLPSALTYPFHVVRKDIFSGREVIFKEFQVCSPTNGLRGVIDVIKIKYDKENKVMNIEAEEIKSHYWSKYLLQLAAYGIILSDPNFRFVQEVTKRKTRRVTFPFYPKEKFTLNIKMVLQPFAKKAYTIDWMENSIMGKNANGMSANVFKIAKRLRMLHKAGLYWLNELPPCSNCNPEQCGFYAKFCSKFTYNAITKTKQMYWGKNFDKKMLIKTKPKINLAELEGMVKIK